MENTFAFVKQCPINSIVHPFNFCLFHHINFSFTNVVSSQMTATHQLKIAVMSVAFVGRSLFLTSQSTSVESVESGDEFTDLLMVSLSNVLLGMDANDPPKTLATMQLIGSIFSNVSTQARNILRKVDYYCPYNHE